MPPRFVAVGQSGLRLGSLDGSAWHHLGVGKDGEIYREVAFGNGRFVAAGNFGGDNIIAATADGETCATSASKINTRR